MPSIAIGRAATPIMIPSNENEAGTCDETIIPVSFHKEFEHVDSLNDGKEPVRRARRSLMKTIERCPSSCACADH